MADAVAKVNKPQLRGLLQSQIKRNLGIAMVICVASGTLFKVLYCDPRKKAYADFYKNYDIDKTFDEIRNKGLFNSCNKD